MFFLPPGAEDELQHKSSDLEMSEEVAEKQSEFYVQFGQFHAKLQTELKKRN